MTWFSGVDVVFCAQLGVSAVGLAVSAGMLAAGRDPAVYLPVLTSIVGYWLPAPRAPRPAAVAPEEQSTMNAAPRSIISENAYADDERTESVADSSPDRELSDITLSTPVHRGAPDPPFN